MRRNQFKALFFLGMFCFSGALFGLAVAGVWGVVVFSGLSIVICLAMAFFGDTFILRRFRAQPVGPLEHRNLFGRVQILANRMGLPPPQVFILPVKGANAMVLGRNPETSSIAVTEDLLELLSEEELNGVLAHQLCKIGAHVTFVSVISAIIAWGLLALVPKHLFTQRRKGTSLVLFFLFAPFAAAIIHLSLNKDREFRADESGVNVLGSSKGLTSALLKLAEALASSPMHLSEAFAHLFIVPPFDTERSVLRLFLTHTSTESRIERLSQLEISMALN